MICISFKNTRPIKKKKYKQNKTKLQQSLTNFVVSDSDLSLN